MRVLLVVSPMTQLNTPYPATAYLTGFLRGKGVDCAQADLALELVLALLSRDGVRRIAEAVQDAPKAVRKHPSVRSFADQADAYALVIEPVVRFLQGKDPSLAYRIVGRGFLPEGPRFAAVDQFEAPEGEDPLAWAFGALGLQDRARWLATLLLDDVADVIREAVDPRFAFVKYAESLAESQASFDPLASALAGPPTLVDEILDDLTRDLVLRHRPDLVGVSAPFSGNVYGAFRIAQAIKRAAPHVRTVLGGGFVNTELRELADPRVFDYFDAITLDDGEEPLLRLIEGRPPLRTYVRRDGAVALDSDPAGKDVPFALSGTPTYDGLPLDRYLGVLEMLNPMHRVWSDTRWNKVTVAHGCYWKKCSFCDVTLDYIGRYDLASAKLTVDRMQALIAETGQTGFHLVDEAAPPKALDAMAAELRDRGLLISWWGNVRFEKTFTPELCQRLADSGCIAISGGLEVASDRLLALMQKGVTVGQVARVTRAFTDAGVMVHAYLMYGFPTQTVQETVDALELVRQLFAEGCLQSAFWHRFGLTAHSPVGRDPAAFGVRVLPEPEVGFARNELDFEDPTGVDHDALGPALDKAVYNFMHGVGLDQDVRGWFPGPVPATTVHPRFIARALREDAPKKRSAIRIS